MTLVQNYESRQVIIEVIEIVLNIYFTLELVLRFALCTNKKEFMKTGLNVVDFISLLPLYLELVIDNQQVLRYARTLAVFRIVKISRSCRYNYTLQVLFNTLKESALQLLLLIFLLLILATVFAYASFYVEGNLRDTQFKSIPHCLWWSFITMTTVRMLFSYI